VVTSLITCFYVWRAVKMFYFVEFLQLTVVHYINNRFSALVIGCYFYLRSQLYDLLWWSYYEFTTKLWRFYDRKFVVRFLKIGPLANCFIILIYIIPLFILFNRRTDNWRINMEGKVVTVMPVIGMTCQNCVHKIESTVAKFPSVILVKVVFLTIFW